MTGLRCRTSDTFEVAKEEEEEPRRAVEDEEAEENQPKVGEQEELCEQKVEDSNKQESTDRAPKRPSALNAVQRVLRVLFGCLAAVACGTLYAAYLSAFHERKFWFSMRQEVERELTFQGGSAIYYYYYKHMVAATSFNRAFYELTKDDRTLAGQTINAVERLSLYPEVVTSYIYRVSGSQQDMVEPVYFYVGTVLALQAVYATALFACSWLMSGTWVAGMLTVAWYVISRPDATKVEQALPLRENWALPYYACQVAALTGFLSNNVGLAGELLCYLTLSATTFTFLLVWEHSHYVLFVQALCLFLMDSLDLVPPRKLSDIHKLYVSSLLLASFFHFHNTAPLVSPLLSLLIGSGLASRGFQMKKGPLVARVMKLCFHFHLVFSTSITVNYLIKKVVPVSKGEFILKFLEMKFGLNTTNDFVSNLLVCQESLQSPGQDLYLRLTQSSILPFYLLVLAVCVVSALQAVYTRLSGQPTQNNERRPQDGYVGERPEVVYHVFHTLIFGSLTLLFDGMKYFWTPYVCAFAAFGVCSPDLWMTVFRWLRVKSVHPVVLSLILSIAVPTIIGFSLWREYGHRILTDLSELGEFYDPDTAKLIGWIRTHLPAATVFAGSPQLLGAIKCGSDAAVTSLPLHSDLDMLRWSEDTYQVYSMRSAEEVYKILTSRKANYVIVEESLCNNFNLDQGCRIKDLLDVANGHVIQDNGKMYAFSRHRRFCHEIKTNLSPYTNYFTRVFWNRSYHVYRINTVISFQY
ncbi:probable C-mannosyltransferase DPY19L4 isoform X1 [Hippocampus comes]|uniref:probable C-mannosyltransferase DPY19L4 isoform X1 n=1 Tax=Hippocampus comes TaxID=109280 RepID=UPI00094E5697|nr:PREDICTED: probable C-mannosyltransferase DPY19L4 isoform X1 [Hippocampus comes]